MFPRFLLPLALALLPAVTQAESSTLMGWKNLADCAAAYRANSEIPDPDRAPSMKAMIADQSKDYETAAMRSYRHDTKASAAHAHRSVSAYVARWVQAFSHKPRAEIEQVIDACPQVGG